MDGLRDPLGPNRREVFDLLRRYDRGGSEAEALASISEATAPRLKAAIDAIFAYERLSRLLMGTFAAVQVISTSQGWGTATLRVTPVGPSFQDAQERYVRTPMMWKGKASARLSAKRENDLQEHGRRP